MIRQSEHRLARSVASDRAGFMLLEVMVALVIAALFLGVLAQAFAGAWRNAQRPAEQMTAMSVARAIAGDVAYDKDRPVRDEQIEGFTYMTTISPLAIVLRESRLAPMPPGGAEAAPITRDENSVAPVLQRVTIAVRAPSGRRLTLETIRLN
jgi:type II secretory pathway component PulJ